MSKPKVCPACTGKGSRNCILGNLPCGNCGGTGKVPANYGKDPIRDFTRSVRAQFKKRGKQ